MEYRLLVNGQPLIAPSATTTTTPEWTDRSQGPGRPSYLNSIFWDHDHPNAYRMQTTSVDLRGKFPIIAEEEAYELVRHWRDPRGQVGPRSVAETYKFIAESGVIDELKRMGYNAIEFLPFNPSVDGPQWDRRYLVFDLFGPNSRYGTPDECKQMMDAFNQAGIAVIMDAVAGHYTDQGNAGIRDIGPVGIHNFKKNDGRNLFGDQRSPWGTYRYDYNNPSVRRFLIDGLVSNLKHYGSAASASIISTGSKTIPEEVAGCSFRS